MYRKFGKRLLDLTLTIAALVLLMPLIVVLAILVRVKLGSPILFRQKRPGLGGRPFTLHKFRTMTDARDARGQLLPDGARLTRFGKFLRAASLDELPELFNVLKGEMSLVGPRPLLMEYLVRYSCRASAAARSEAGDNRLGADQRAQRDQLGREVQARCLVRRSHRLSARPENHLYDARKDSQARRHQRRRSSYDACLHGIAAG